MQDSLRPFSRENRLKTAAITLAAAACCLFFGGVILSGIKILSGACIIAFLVLPIAKLFEKKIARPAACLLALLLIVFMLLALFAVLLPVLARQLRGIAELLPEAFLRIRNAAEGLIRFFEQHVPDIGLSAPDFGSMEGSLNSLAKQTISYAGSIAGGIYQLVLSCILACFLIADRERVLLRAEMAVPSPWRSLAVRMGGSLLREMRLYLRGQATIALSVAVLAGAELSIIGIKAAPLMGLIVGLFNVIPYFGPFIGGIPAVIMALSISWQKAGFTVLALFLVQQIDSLVLSPRIMGSITGFSPGIVLLAIFLAQQSAGIWGMLLAMPLLMSFRTAYRVFVQRHENN